MLIKPLFVIFFDVGLVAAVLMLVKVRSLLTICTRERLVWGASLFDTKLILSVTNNFFDNVLVLNPYRERDACMRRLDRSHTSLLAFTNLTLGRTGGGGGGEKVDATPCKVFLSFFLEDKTSVPDVFSCCLFIPGAHFERGLVMVSCYRYEI